MNHSSHHTSLKVFSGQPSTRSVLLDSFFRLETHLQLGDQRVYTSSVYLGGSIDEV